MTQEEKMQRLDELMDQVKAIFSEMAKLEDEDEHLVLINCAITKLVDEGETYSGQSLEGLHGRTDLLITQMQKSFENSPNKKDIARHAIGEGSMKGFLEDLLDADI